MKRSFRNQFILILKSCFILSCSQPESLTTGTPTRFERLDADRTGIEFENTLDYDRNFNIYTYRNFYNGGGIGIGDFNADGLMDFYATANMGPNKLYLNGGNFTFEDVTEAAGVAGTKAWSTGVSIADINADGLPDIYVCNSGSVKGDNKQNELFINQGNGTFTEQAEAYNLADRGFGTHAVFFDYDRDGDLDCYLLNNSYQAIGSFNLRKNQRNVTDPVGGDKLFRNDSGRFINVTAEAGIYSSVIGFGLGITVGDINKDGWPDMYISNDFFERDYLYLNNQQGGFDEVLEQQINSITLSSMGADLADMNNDTWPELFVTEMLPGTNERVKTVTTFENWDRYQYNLANGYYHQFTRNMLQRNNANGSFSEIGRQMNVHATDWSWGALIADFDLDTDKDLFVANGIYQDLTNQDFLQYASNEQMAKTMASGEVDFQELIDLIPSVPVKNYFFKNQLAESGELDFVDQAASWGMAEESFSNGAAYADFDNDGDLDLIINNVNAPLWLFKNNTREQKNGSNYLQLQLTGEGANTAAVGTQITAFVNGQSLYIEQMPVRGFQSSVDPRPLLGLGNARQADSLVVRWPDGRQTVLANVEANQSLQLAQADAPAGEIAMPAAPQAQYFAAPDTTLLPHRHIENTFVDFDRDRLLFHMVSTEGPAVAKADVNADGLEDIFIGGARDQQAVLYLQTRNGGFTRSDQPAFAAHAISEDVDAIFFDADGDGDADLYVASGGNEFSASSNALLDRLYINNNGRFTDSQQLLPHPSRYISTGAVAATDVDADGDIDLFVGSRLVPFYYGVAPDSYLLLNDGSGRFSLSEQSKLFTKLGMVRDAAWADIDDDGDDDLLVIGEWMRPKLYLNTNGQLAAAPAGTLPDVSGWFNQLLPLDIDADGDMDFVLGNHGHNSRFRASAERPIQLTINDFDGNGSPEHIISMYEAEKDYPLALRHDLIKQLPGLKKKYLKYDSYRDQGLTDIFGAELVEKSVKTQVNELASGILLNNGGSFTWQALPAEAQISATFGIAAVQLGQQRPALLLGGNLYNVKPEVGRYDASYGTLLLPEGATGYRAVKNATSGLQLQGEIRQLLWLNRATDSVLVAVPSDGAVQVVKQLDLP